MSLSACVIAIDSIVGENNCQKLKFHNITCNEQKVRRTIIILHLNYTTKFLLPIC